MRFQTAYLYSIGKAGVQAEFPDKFEIILEKDAFPYPRGSYLLGPSSVHGSRDSGLEVRPVLVPVPASAPVAPSK